MNPGHARGAIRRQLGGSWAAAEQAVKKKLDGNGSQSLYLAKEKPCIKRWQRLYKALAIGCWQQQMLETERQTQLPNRL